MQLAFQSLMRDADRFQDVLPARRPLQARDRDALEPDGLPGGGLELVADDVQLLRQLVGRRHRHLRLGLGQGRDAGRLLRLRSAASAASIVATGIGVSRDVVEIQLPGSRR